MLLSSCEPTILIAFWAAGLNTATVGHMLVTVILMDHQDGLGRVNNTDVELSRIVDEPVVPSWPANRKWR